jgi:hypothetical protein
MSTDIELASRYSTMTSIVTLALGVMFLFTSCSTFISNQKESLNNTPAAQQPTTAQVSESAVETGSAPEIDKTVDKTMDNWEKARAAYLRTLDYAAIDQQNNDHSNYLVKSDLVESRYHIKTSDAAMYVERDYRKALHELQEAEKNFGQAIKTAGSHELQPLDNTKTNLDDLLTQAQLSAQHDCAYPRPSNYHQVEAQIENLLKTL